MKKPKPVTTAAAPEAPIAVKEQHGSTLMPLTEKLSDIREEAKRNRSHTATLITQLQAQREQLDEMRTEIDATIAFLRAQHGK